MFIRLTPKFSGNGRMSARILEVECTDFEGGVHADWMLSASRILEAGLGGWGFVERSKSAPSLGADWGSCVRVMREVACSAPARAKTMPEAIYCDQSYRLVSRAVKQFGGSTALI